MNSLARGVSSPDIPEPRLATGMHAALARRSNWEQLAGFGVVGGRGCLVTLSLYTFLLRVVGIHHIAAAAVAFVGAVLNEYMWKRRWTFRNERAGLAAQGPRFFVVSTAAGALALLHELVSAGTGKVSARAISVVLVMPLNFVGNKLWTFRVRASPLARPV